MSAAFSIDTKPNFRGVALPYKPPIDKIAAMVLLQRHNGAPLETVEYHKANECPDALFAFWKKEGIYPIDLGQMKYHKAGVGSATEFVANDLSVPLTNGEKRVVSLINQNNGDGSLKRGAKFSVVQIVRDLYELTNDQDYHLNAIAAAADVVDAFIRVEDDERVRDEEGIVSGLAGLYEELLPCQYRPMTLGRYMRDLWILGEDPKTIRRKLNFWLEEYRKVRIEYERGREAFASMKTRQTFKVGTFDVLFLPTDDRFIANAAIMNRDYPIRIIRGSGGHTTISTMRLDMSAVATKLQEIEPGRWYHQTEMGTLINGGPQYVDTPPTALWANELVKLMRTYPPTQREAKK